jgi:hypothetical protein
MRSNKIDDFQPLAKKICNYITAISDALSSSGSQDFARNQDAQSHVEGYARLLGALCSIEYAIVNFVVFLTPSSGLFGYDFYLDEFEENFNSTKVDRITEKMEPIIFSFRFLRIMV